MKHQKVIAIFTGFYLPHLGGVEFYTHNLARNLHQKGYKVIIVTSNHANLPNFKNNEFHIYRLPTFALFRQRYPIFRLNREYRNLISRIKQEKIDCVICNTRYYFTTYIGSKIAYKLHIPTLLIEHGSSHYSVDNIILDFFGKIYEHIFTKLIKSKIHHFYSVSNACNDWLRHFNIQADGVLYNAIDPSDYTSFQNQHYFPKNKAILITYAGRIIKSKNVNQLLEAYQSISSKFPNTLLAVAGDGPLLEGFKKKYNNKHIKFLGRLNHNQIMTLYNDTDILVYPSTYPEGLPTAILEAGLMKCAVIATNLGGISEIISHPKYGIITSGNKIDLESHLHRLLSHPDKINSLKTQLHNHIIKNFTWENTTQKLIKIIEEEL